MIQELWDSAKTILRGKFITAQSYLGASPVARLVKNLPAMWETWVQSLGWKTPLEKGMVTHFNILAWRIPRAEESCGLQSMGSQRVRCK